MKDSTARKITLNLSEDNFNAVSQLSEQLQVNKTFVVNQAIRLEKFVQEVMARGAKIIIEEQDGKQKEVVIR